MMTDFHDISNDDSAVVRACAVIGDGPDGVRMARIEVTVCDRVRVLARDEALLHMGWLAAALGVADVHRDTLEFIARPAGINRARRDQVAKLVAEIALAERAICTAMGLGRAERAAAAWG